MIRRPIQALFELGAISLTVLLWLSQTVPLAYWWQLATIWLALAVITAVMARSHLPAAALLNAGVLLIIGWLFMIRIEPQLGWDQWRGSMIGLLVFTITLMFDWSSFRYKYLAGVSALLLLSLTIIFGEEAGGARAWLRIGAIRFQPVEFAKIGMLLFTAAHFEDHHTVLFSSNRLQMRYWSPLLVLAGLMLIHLAVQRDLGPALLYMLAFISLILYCSSDWKVVLAAAAAACCSACFAWLGFAHVQQRILLWLNPWAEPTGPGFQAVQGLFAVHNGGLIGRGIGFGLGVGIPAVHTDYIWALICEELGLLGATAVLGFYLLLVFFCLRTAVTLRGRSRILVLGIALLWAYQVFLVAGGVLGVIPLSGMTLPFISYGSTSISANMLMLGIVTRLAVCSEPKEERRRERRRIKWAFRLVIAMFAVLWGAAAYWQLIRTDLAANPLNPKVMQVYKSARGNIYDRRGRLLASTEYDGKQYIRIYHGHPSLSHVIGYFHPRYGMAGVEAVYNHQLAANRDLYLTIDAELQAAIDQYMHPYRGAVVVTNPRTGEVLALYSSPYVDPNQLDVFWEDYLNNPDSPFVNRATYGIYPPGSTIKPFILAAAYQTGIAASETTWHDEGLISFAGRTINNFQGQALGWITTEEALASSSNVVFAQMAVGLKTELLNYFKRFGFGEAPGFLPGPQQSEFGWAQLGIGQGDLLVTPLQMAAAVSTIANRGLRLEPYLVQSVVRRWLPHAAEQVITQRTAALVRQAMVEAVANGTGRAAQIPGMATAGKTGTAENAQGRDHAWFVGFAPADNPEVAVVVLIEHGGYGGEAAARIAGQVMMRALDRS